MINAPVPAPVTAPAAAGVWTAPARAPSRATTSASAASEAVLTSPPSIRRATSRRKVSARSRRSLRAQRQRGPAKLPQRGRLVTGLPGQQIALLLQILRASFVYGGDPTDQQSGGQRPQLGGTGELRQQARRRHAPGLRQKRERPPGDRHRGDQAPRAITRGERHDHQPDRMRAQVSPAEVRRRLSHRDRRQHDRRRDGRFDHQATGWREGETALPARAHRGGRGTL
jgi:hypothetical protein